MRLKIFTAGNMQEALELVRAKLGDDAVIIDSYEEGSMVKITAAIEAPVARTNPRTTPPPRPENTPVHRSLRELEEEFSLSKDLDFDFFLTHHGLLENTRLTITEMCDALERETPLLCLAGALDSIFHFETLHNDYSARPVMLVGPPGSGKTVTAAKLASQAVLNGFNVRLVSTDTERTGGLAQLEGYANVLHVPLTEVTSPDDLAMALREQDELIIIDTMGYNPFNTQDMADLHEWITAAEVEPILVSPAGADITDAQEIAETYSRIGVRRFIASRLDVARRFGGLIATAEKGRMAFAGASITPYLGDGIENIDALALAKLLTKIPQKNSYSPEADPDEQS